MVPTQLTWKEKWLAKEEDSGDSSEDADTQGITEAVRDEGASNANDQTGGGTMDVNMVFIIPDEFHAPGSEVAELTLGAERAVFEKLEQAGEHMKPLFIKGNLDSTPVGRMMTDRGASINIMLLWMFEKLGHSESDLKRTNLSLSGFLGELVEA
jgi:hypothetical protein